jgi:hypothetical protein
MRGVDATIFNASTGKCVAAGQNELTAAVRSHKRGTPWEAKLGIDRIDVRGCAGARGLRRRWEQRVVVLQLAKGLGLVFKHHICGSDA